MSFTYDITLSTNRDKVRRMIRDTDTANPSRQLYPDETITAILTGTAQDLFLAAAELLEGLVVNAALLHKAEKIGDFTIDAKGMAAALLTMAKHYRGLSEDAPAFDFAELNLSTFNELELIVNDVLRTQ